MSDAAGSESDQEADFLSFGWGWGNHSGLGRCTRYVAYEPGRDRYSGLIEKQWGRFTFEAKLLSRLIVDVRGETLNEWDSDQGIQRWLARSDAMDKRVTRFPGNCHSLDGWVERLLGLQLCQTFCLACSAKVSPSQVPKAIWAEAAFHSFSEIRCPEGHLLIRPLIIHVVRTYSKVPIELERPLSREEMRYRENEAKSSISLEQLLGDEDKS